MIESSLKRHEELSFQYGAIAHAWVIREYPEVANLAGADQVKAAVTWDKTNKIK